MIFWRIKSLDSMLATAAKKSLHRSLGVWQLTLLGIGAIIGTGIFVLTAEAAQKAGPGMMIAFVIAGFVCAVAALCYSELSSMVPISGSAYTYSYAVLGELIAWMVGWALILEYSVAAGAVAVGWSGYFVGLLNSSLGIKIPFALVNGPFAGGIINLPAVIICILVVSLLIIGTRESATFNATLVAVKIVALTAFIALALPVADMNHFDPFLPLGTSGVAAAAASIFFAYVGFDAVSTAAEETKDPQRNLPIALISSLLICTLFYLLISAGVVGAVGAQPLIDATGEGLMPGSREMAAQCKLLAAVGQQPVVCSHEALAHVLRQIGWEKVGNLIGLAAFLALPSVILMMLFGQTRIFFVMSRDGLLPEVLSHIHPRFKTPYIVTLVTGLVVTASAAFLPVGKLANISNSGTLFAFLVVALSVMILRIKDKNRARPFKAPVIWLVGPLAIGGCITLFLFLPTDAQLVFPIWTGVGLIFYFLYGYRRSHVLLGISTPPGGENLIEPIRSLVNHEEGERDKEK
ncbi:amino acid permease [Nitrosomonas eutropha]|uniref:Amino acid/polyamine/organocation transporter (APC superfamily) n=2 Tax=Nitrosomonas eutropha TaxID=916 RepID=A0ABX5M4T9_9PROT|nr:amino acid permease [Nitrosomonas eutropha]ABI59481.1 amino acid/polyamine/organocation transporter, APC superfamily [Nitrosomonas eutropha C91]PXV73825.1 amino acid/polyamine/organocation transporter (APC superfamily) [Nitrosomonas eutropha]SCX27494.1 amino acid/polyamine/organocation transporter, APC superfamily [Nitrosomonas eutropha]SEJ20659.1 amino acid/polyamine/organocation transporter, APC superfamily [Nitrosomonas eutropha]